MILGFVRASQNGTANAVDAVAGDNNTHANCSGIQLNGQLFDVADNDTDANDFEIPLSAQLFEFAQLFSLVNLNSNINRSVYLNQNTLLFEGMPKIGPWEYHHLTAVCIHCIEFTFTSDQWLNA